MILTALKISLILGSIGSILIYLGDEMTVLWVIGVGFGLCGIIGICAALSTALLVGMAPQQKKDE
jgi:hypothetical protein